MSRGRGFDSDYLRVHLRPIRISQESGGGGGGGGGGVVPAGWHVARYLGSARDGVLGSQHFLEGLRFRRRDVKFAHKPKLFISCESDDDKISMIVER
jgi:hypothetical protein